MPYNITIPSCKPPGLSSLRHRGDNLQPREAAEKLLEKVLQENQVEKHLERPGVSTVNN